MSHMFDENIGDLKLNPISHDNCYEANSQILLKVKSTLQSSIHFSRTSSTVPSIPNLNKVSCKALIWRFLIHKIKINLQKVDRRIDDNSDDNSDDVESITNIEDLINPRLSINERLSEPHSDLENFI